MTDLERELLATIERMTGSQMLQATTELTTAVKQLSLVLTTFAEAMTEMAYSNRQVTERSRDIFRVLKRDLERGTHGDTEKPTR